MNSMLNKTLLAVALVAVVGGNVEAGNRGAARPAGKAAKSAPKKAVATTSRFAQLKSAVTSRGSKAVSFVKETGKNHYGKIAAGAGVAVAGGAAYKYSDAVKGYASKAYALGAAGVSRATSALKTAGNYVATKAQAGASWYSNKIGFVNTGLVVAAGLAAKVAYDYVKGSAKPEVSSVAKREQAALAKHQARMKSVRRK